ncbi:MAG TPA: hypothetical protein VJH88_01765 [Candidatus Nanoarchaeia archaeon]|nr:hypothetical protein [Candidatus Nanoarchaeia archaeon]
MAKRKKEGDTRIEEKRDYLREWLEGHEPRSREESLKVLDIFRSERVRDGRLAPVINDLLRRLDGDTSFTYTLEHAELALGVRKTLGRDERVDEDQREEIVKVFFDIYNPHCVRFAKLLDSYSAGNFTSTVGILEYCFKQTKTR